MISITNVKYNSFLSLPINYVILLISLLFISHRSQLYFVESIGCSTQNNEPICCIGKQSNCFVYINKFTQYKHNYPYHNYPAKLFNTIQDKLNQRCFCDENCLITKDCCPNYHTMCSNRRIDCKVSDWGPWSKCNRTCGTGSKTRYRKVVIPNKGGGLSCPVLSETKKCVGRQCISRRVGRSGTLVAPYVYEIKNEVAHLLPVRGDVLNLTRLYDMRWDVRRKLYMGRLIKMNKTEQPDPEPYCAMYEITQSNHACQSHNILWKFKPNVNQQNGPQSNFYYRQRRNTFTFSRNPYLHNGMYNRLIEAEKINRFNEWDKTGLDSKAWITHASLLIPGQQICVTCYSFYMRKDLGYRCTGTGLPDLETRWRALRTSDCQGRFRMIGMPKRSCTCGRGVASFVFV